MFSSDEIKHLLWQLSESLHKPLSTNQLEVCHRILRPINRDNQKKLFNQYGKVVKNHVRQVILTEPSIGIDGPIHVAKFEQDCEKLNYLNPGLLTPILMVLKPFIFNAAVFSRNKENDSKENFTEVVLVKEKEMSKLSAITFATIPLTSNIQSLKEAETLKVVDTLKDQNISRIWLSRENEFRLLKDLLYIFQGIQGKYVKFDVRSENYVIDPTLDISPSVRDPVLCLCEVGWLYSTLSQFLKTTFDESSSGLIKQAFASALQEELNEYYRLLAVLEQEIFKSEKLKSSAVVEDSALINLKENFNISSEPISLTLLRLRTWMQEPIERLCLMVHLVESGGPLKGGALASKLHFHARHGNPSLRSLVLRLMDSVCKPWFTMLSRLMSHESLPYFTPYCTTGRWVIRGELHDPCNEFFVVATTVTNSPQYNSWLHAYQMRNPLIPSFLSHALASKVFLIGKSINFLKQCIQMLPKQSKNSKTSKAEKFVASIPDHDSTMKVDAKGGSIRPSYRAINKSKKLTSYGKVVDSSQLDNDTGSLEVNSSVDTSTDYESILDREIEASIKSLRYEHGETGIQELISKISTDIDKRLLQLLETRFHIFTHLSALKKFMLLGQGDFVTCLMDTVGQELKERASQLYRHRLLGMLEGSLRASNAQFEPSFVLDRVGIRLLEAAPGDSGWEVFSLDYEVDAPLNALVHHEAISKYRIAFHMLWRLKRVEWSLSSAWKQVTAFTHIKNNDKLAAFKPVFHRCTLQRARMSHVVTNLSAFLMFEVMESAWVTLTDTISRAQNFDDVIKAHDMYLKHILEKALLSAEHEALNLQLQQLLQIILRFCSLEESLIADALASLARGRLLKTETKLERDTRGGGKDSVPEYLITRIDEAIVEYSKNFDSLLQMLKDQGEKYGENLRFLTFRLTFNEYYESFSN